MYNLKVYTSNIYVANYRDTVANHGSVFSRNNLHFRSCIFTNCMFLIARHYHWRKAVSNKREIALLKKIQLVSKRRDNFKCWVLLLLFSLWNFQPYSLYRIKLGVWIVISFISKSNFLHSHDWQPYHHN